MESKSSNNSVTLKIAILSLGFIGMNNSFVSPALATIAAAFPDVSMANIQLIMTFGLFGFFPMTLITGGLASKFRTKSLVLIGALLMIIGGLFPLLIHSSIFHLYFSQLLMGAGGGILMTLSSALIPKLWEGPTRARMFGLDGACQRAGGMIMTFVAGILAAQEWHLVYWAGVFFIPSFFLILFFLPRDDKPQIAMQEAAKEATSAPKSKGWHPAAFPIGIYVFLQAIVFGAVMINFAMLMDAQLAEGPAMAGTLASASGLISIVAGILYKNIADALKQNMVGLGATLITIGVVISFLASNVPIFFIGLALVNLGFTLGFVGAMAGVAKVVPPEKLSSSMALFMAFQSGGSMICPYIVNPITILTHGEASALGNYQVAAVIGVIIIIYAFVWGAKNRKAYQAETLPTSAAQ